MSKRTQSSDRALLSAYPVGPPPQEPGPLALSSRQGRGTPYSPEVRSRAIPRVAAPRIRRTTTARTARSESICTMATIRAGSVFGVMSPKPTVEKTVTVK